MSAREREGEGERVRERERSFDILIINHILVLWWHGRFLANVNRAMVCIQCKFTQSSVFKFWISEEVVLNASIQFCLSHTQSFLFIRPSIFPSPSLSLPLSFGLSVISFIPVGPLSLGAGSAQTFTVWLVWLSGTLPDGCRATQHCPCAVNHGEHLSPVCGADSTSSIGLKHLRSDQHPQGIPHWTPVAGHRC